MACDIPSAVLVAPNKQSIYGEFLTNVAAEVPPSRFDVLLSALGPVASEIIIDPRPLMRDAKRVHAPVRLYNKTDTHWNDLGAYYGYVAVMQRMATLLPDHPEVSPLDEYRLFARPYGGGDMAARVLFSPWRFDDEDVSLTPKAPLSVQEEVQVDDGHFVSRNPSATGRLIVFGDSFAERMVQFFTPHFNEVHRYLGGTFDGSIIAIHRPQFVLLEVTERYLDELLIATGRLGLSDVTCFSTLFMVCYGLKHTMSSSFPEFSVTQVAGVEIRVEPWFWPFATARRQEIDAYFTDLKRQRAALWNGRVLMLNSYSVSNGVFTGTAFETDYANLCAWRDWAFPDQTVFNFFAPAAIRTCDGAYVLGEMAPYTAGAGKITFPSGTPEPGDIIDGSVDLMGNMRREIAEETGLSLDELESEAGWSFVSDRNSLVLVKRFSSSQTGDKLLARIKSYLENETQPEFSDVRIVRRRIDFHPRMEPFTLAFLEHESRCGRLST